MNIKKFNKWKNLEAALYQQFKCKIQLNEMKSTFECSKFKNEQDSEQKSTIGSDKARKNQQI
jgi:hypothetical protein